MPDGFRQYAETCIIRNTVSELQTMVQGKEEMFERKWSAEHLIVARKYVKIEGYELIDVRQPLSKAIFSGIIDNVKNKLLDFLLELDEKQLIMEGVEISQENVEAAKNTFNITVYGDHANVATGLKVSLTVNTVAAGDLDSLKKILRDHNVEEKDIDELQKSIRADGAIADGKFGKKVSAWLGRMVSKASDGSWNIALNVAPALLTEALKKYFGL